MIQQLLSQNWKLDTDFMSLLYYFVTFYNKITLKILQVFQRYITISTYINVLAPKIGYTCHAMWCSKCWMSGINGCQLTASLSRSL